MRHFAFVFLTTTCGIGVILAYLAFFPTNTTPAEAAQQTLRAIEERDLLRARTASCGRLSGSHNLFTGSDVTFTNLVFEERTQIANRATVIITGSMTLEARTLPLHWHITTERRDGRWCVMEIVNEQAVVALSSSS